MHFYCYLAPSFVPSLSTATSTSTSTTSTSFTPWGRELTLKSRRAVAAVWGGGDGCTWTIGQCFAGNWRLS